jgi:hypothetical protein
VFEEEYSCYGVVNKVLVKGNEVCNFFIFTSTLQIISVEVVDRGFILFEDFPKEGNFIFLDNLQYHSCIHVDHKDLSIAVHDIPTASNLDNVFPYLQTKFSNRSVFKLTS